MGFESLPDRDGRNCKYKATALSRGIMGRKPSAKVGSDEQELDTRSSFLGK